MDLNKNIESIKEYFVTFNVTEGVAYILVKFPKGWVVEKENNGLPIESVADSETGGYYFMTDIANGTDMLFDSVKNIISLNREIEDKKQLFSVKLQELKNLFSEKTLDELKSLKFTINAPWEKESAKEQKNDKKKDKSAQVPTENKTEETPEKETVKEGGK